MNYTELKKIYKSVLKLNAQIETLRSVAESTTKNLSKAPAFGSGADKSQIVDEIVELSRERDGLMKIINEQKAILETTYEGNCIILHLFSGYSYDKIAKKIKGNNTSESIRKMCQRFIW